MAEKSNLTDETARGKIKEDLDKTLYVEAGAGTGKTTSLVDRIVAIVLSGKAKIHEIAAITFTEAAASELKSRIRESLDEYSVKTTINCEEQSRIIEGQEGIDRASIQTLHSFAADLIRQFPIQSGITPGFDILDAFEDETLLNEFLKSWLDSKMTTGDTAPFFKIFISLDAPLDPFMDVGAQFWHNYDLLDEVDFPTYFPPTPPGEDSIDRLQKELLRLIKLAKFPDEDMLHAHVLEKIEELPLLRSALSSKHSGLYMCSNFSEVFSSSTYRPPAYKLKSNLGRQGDWEEDNITGINGCKLIKELLKDFSKMVDAYVLGWAKHAMMPLLEDLKESILKNARQRKVDGELTYHDLLIYSRKLIRDNSEIRNIYKKMYKYILIDEFQDTDPIQAEIATFLCEDLFTVNDPDLIKTDWKHVTTKTGKMFAVGDPKQSIFRFRRADVSVADTIKNQIADEEIYLTNNFRSQEAIIKWVNKVFGSIITESENQPAYIPLEVGSTGLDSIQNAKVKFFGAETNGKAAEIRGVEAFDVPRIIARAVTEKWLIRDSKLEEPTSPLKVRPITLNDICILSPTRYALEGLLKELEDIGIPYRLESSFSVYYTQEIYDLLNNLKAINNPKDYVSVIATLKSQIFGCSDRDIAMHQELGGSLNFSVPIKSSIDSIEKAFSLLNRLYLEKGIIPVSRLIEKLIRERGTLAYSLSKRWPREHWRKYQLIIDKARILNENNSRSLTFFIEWLEGQIITGARSFESIVPDADENAIRVMTIHASKGLEFPLVLLVGITGAYGPTIEKAIFGRDPGQVEVALTKHLATEGYKYLSDLEKKALLEERKRLLYVATTRARDYLIVSAYRGESKVSQAQWFIDALEGEDKETYWEEIAGIDPHQMIESLTVNDKAVSQPSKVERQSWIEKHMESLKLSSLPATVTATGLVNELKEESFLEEEPWRRGRAGTKIGRAVHSILQTIDLSGNTDIQSVVDSQAKIEGVIESRETIKSLVGNAINSNIIKRAIASNRIWREVPVMAPIGDQIIEGIIDLVFEEDGELVIVDYKTDRLQTPDEIQQAVNNYRIQLAAYSYAVSKSTGKNVKEAGLALLYPDQFILIDKTAFHEEDLKMAVNKWIDSVYSKQGLI